MAFIDGQATWFCCGTEGYPMSCCPCIQAPCNDCNPPNGACGTCHTDSWGCAWQNVTGYPPAYCSMSTQFACGQGIWVFSHCSGVGIQVPVTDHGPGACTGIVAQDCAAATNRIIDLTPAAFAQLRDLSFGTFSVQVQI